MKSLPLDLLERYREPVPRYTSYPAVMHWRTPPAKAAWTADLAATLSRPDARLSLYVHIPFCQSLCSFCGCNVRIVRNHALAAPYVDALLREFALYRELLPGVPLTLGELHLGGGTPTYLPAGELDRLLDGLLEHCIVAPGADLAIEADPRNTTREQLGVLRRHGFGRLSLGVQDFDPRVQEIINRVHDTDTVRRVVDMARESGFGNLSFDLIHGLPLQTPESLSHTFRAAAGMRPDRISFLPYAHVPWIKSSQRQYTEETSGALTFRFSGDPQAGVNYGGCMVTTWDAFTGTFAGGTITASRRAAYDCAGANGPRVTLTTRLVATRR